MVTPNDTLWTERLQNVMPANFMANTSTSYTQNQGFLENMVNRIGKTVILGQPNAYNPFTKWTDPVMDYGDTIQKYGVPYIEGQAPDYDPANPNPYKTVKRHPEVQYIQFNDDIQYKQTIFNLQLKQAFVSQNTLGSFVSEQMGAMYKSAGMDQYLKWVKYLSKQDYVPDNEQARTKITYSDDDQYAWDVLKKLKALVTKEMKFPSKKFNVSGMLSGSPMFDVIMTVDTKNAIDFALKGVFNLEKVNIPGIDIITVDSFNTVDGAGPTEALDVVILSKGMAHYVPRSPESGALYNPENYYYNYWYKEAGAFSFDPFFNAAQIYKSIAA